MYKMLLPSALPCEQSSTTHTRLQASLQSNLASPPQSPSALNNLYTTCRNLQSLLIPCPPARQQPTPPLSHATPPNLKLRLRARNVTSAHSEQPSTPRTRITKRVPERGNKRRRVESDDEDGESEVPSTPKRIHLAPEVLPLGLERSDFHSLRHSSPPVEPQQQYHQQQRQHHQWQCNDNAGASEREREGWNAEEDRLLVELVLEKMRLTKSEWQDCARSLGKDRVSVGRRWQTLMGAGEVGLKRRSQIQRRGRVAGTWR